MRSPLIAVARPLALCLCSGVALASPSAQGQVRTVGDGGPERGAFWLTQLDVAGNLVDVREFGERGGRLPFHLGQMGHFGSALAMPGDLNADGVPDLVIGAPLDDRTGVDHGVVWLAYRAADGSLSGARLLAEGQAGWTGTLADRAAFGGAVAGIGDLDGDGNTDIAVGAPGNSGLPGSVWILFLDGTGRVRSAREIGVGQGGFAGPLQPGDGFGSSLAWLGNRLAVGAPGDDTASTDGGALFMLSLTNDGSVQSSFVIRPGSGGFTGTSVGEGLGSAVTPLGDVNGDGIGDLALGASGSDVGGADHGAVWILFLRADGRVQAQQQIARGVGGLGLGFTSLKAFGAALAGLGDRNGDTVPDVLVGAPREGALYVLDLHTDGTVAQVKRLTQGPVSDRFGSALASLGDLDGDGQPDVAVGASERPGAAEDFTSLAAAASAAGDGDTLLVRASLTGRATVSGKSVAILAETPTGVGDMEIGDLGPGQRVLLQSLVVTRQDLCDFFGGPIPQLPLVSLHDDQGTVWIDHCSSPAVLQNTDSFPSVFAENCRSVVLLNSDLSGQPVEPDPFCGNGYPNTGFALQTRSANVAIHGCTLLGVDGYLYDGGSSSVYLTPGAAAILSESPLDEIFTSRVNARGGDGLVFPETFVTWVCSAGGGGIVCGGVLRTLDSRFVGGAGGQISPGNPCAPDGPDRSGTVQDYRGRGMSFSLRSPAHAGEDVELVCHGPASVPVWLLSASEPFHLTVPQSRGLLLVHPSARTEFLGYTDLHGDLRVLRSLPALPPGVEIETRFLQVVYQDLTLHAPAGAMGKLHQVPEVFVLGGAAAQVTLDPRL